MRRWRGREYISPTSLRSIPDCTQTRPIAQGQVGGGSKIQMSYLKPTYPVAGGFSFSRALRPDNVRKILSVNVSSRLYRPQPATAVTVGINVIRLNNVLLLSDPLLTLLPLHPLQNQDIHHKAVITGYCSWGFVDDPSKNPRPKTPSTYVHVRRMIGYDSRIGILLDCYALPL